MTPGRYTVVERDEDDDDDEGGNGAEQVLGTVTLAADGRLALIDQADPDDDRLVTIVDELNAEEELHVEAPPPAGARPFEVYTRIVERGTDGFVPALVEHLKRYYDIELRPA